MIRLTRSLLVTLAFAGVLPGLAGATTHTVFPTVVATYTEPPCTLFASPTGTAGATGSSPTTPTSLAGARTKSVAGSIVCLLAGTYGLSSTFYVSKSGTAGQPIVYRADRGTALPPRTGSSPPARRAYPGVPGRRRTHHAEFPALTNDGAQ